MSFSQKGVEKILAKQWSDVAFLAEGGNSFVYTFDKKSKAIKVLRQHNRYTRFKREVLDMSRLQDIQGVAKILDSNLPSIFPPPGQFSEVTQIAYIILPYYSGGTLKERISIASDGGYEAVETALKIIAVIKGMHQKKMAHRDLKPDNILFDEDGGLFVSDFGLCLDLETEYRHTKYFEMVGSIWYRGPEFLRGRLDDDDHRPGDIFSLGRILWALIVGREPIGMTDEEFYKYNILETVSSLRRPSRLNEIIQSATAIDPKKRINVIQLEDLLKEWKEEQPIQSPSKLIEAAKDSPIYSERIGGLNSQREEELLRGRIISAVQFAFESDSVTQKWRQVACALPICSFNSVSTDSIERYASDFPIGTFSQPFIAGVGLRFNLGDDRLFPLMMVQFALALSDGELQYEITCHVIPKGKDCTDRVSMTPILRAVLGNDIVLIAKIEKDIRSSLNWVDSQSDPR